MVFRAIGTDTGPQPYDITGFTLSQPTNGQILMRQIAPREVRLLDNPLAGSTVATTAETIYPIKVDGGTIGTITYALGETDGTVAYTGSGLVPRGSVISVEAPATADATHDGLFWSLTAETGE